MSVILFISVDQNNQIGNSDGSLPWDIKSINDRFEKLSSGKAVLIGHNTLRSNNEMSKHGTIVLSKSIPKDSRKDLVIARSLDWLIAHQACLGCQPPEIWIAGGKDVFIQVLERGLVDIICLTQVHTDSKAEVQLPFDLYNWKSFVLQQQKKGHFWVLTKQEFPPPEEGQPTTTFSIFRKLK